MTTTVPAGLTTTGPRAAPARAVGLGRVAAVLAVGSAGLHLLLAASGELSAVVMALMALACLPCAWHLWRGPSGQVWALTALIDLGMLAVHAPMVLSVGNDHAMHHTQPLPSAGWLSVVLVVGQLGLAAIAVLVARGVSKQAGPVGTL